MPRRMAVAFRSNAESLKSARCDERLYNYDALLSANSRYCAAVACFTLV